MYTITEYIETGGVLVADGLYQCVKALCKEYYMNYPSLRGVVPHIVVEVDSNNYASPSLSGYIKRNSLVPMDNIYRMQIRLPEEERNMNGYFAPNQTYPHIKSTYVRMPEYRTGKMFDNIRHDVRKFNAQGLMRMMPEEVNSSGIGQGIYDDNQLRILIENLGFKRATQLEIKEYFMHQGVVEKILLDADTLNMPKAISPEEMYRAGGLVAGSGNDVNTINNALFNPMFNQKMNRMFNANNMSPEAKDFMNEHYARNRMMQQQNMSADNTWQTPTMTGGAFYVPNMPGM
jgi:hypothetical protein